MADYFNYDRAMPSFRTPWRSKVMPYGNRGVNRLGDPMQFGNRSVNRTGSIDPLLAQKRGKKYAN